MIDGPAPLGLTAGPDLPAISGPGPVGGISGLGSHAGVGGIDEVLVASDHINPDRLARAVAGWWAVVATGIPTGAALDRANIIAGRKVPELAAIRARQRQPVPHDLRDQCDGAAGM